MCVGKGLSDRVEGRCGQDEVADVVGAKEEDFESVVGTGRFSGHYGV